MTSSSTTVPGMMYPTQKGMVGTTPADSARMATLNKAQSQSNANRLMAGGIRSHCRHNSRHRLKSRRLKSRKLKSRKLKSRHRLRGGVITVPTYQMLYEPQGGPGTDPNSQIQSNSITSTQMAKNATFDNHATIKGGRKTMRRRHHSY
jgi:hypothetical protein